jgi:cellobiose-specific phosphotransferase system component IIB
MKGKGKEFGGDYIWPGGISIHNKLFLAAIHDQARDVVLKDLRDSCLGVGKHEVDGLALFLALHIYLLADEEARCPGPGGAAAAGSPFSIPFEEIEATTRDVIVPLGRWAEKHHLLDRSRCQDEANPPGSDLFCFYGWLFRQAYQTLRWWAVDEKAGDRLDWYDSPPPPPDDRLANHPLLASQEEQHELSITLPAWEPTRKKENVALKEMLALVMPQVKAMLQQAKQTAEAQGAVPVSRKIDKGKHEFLVLHQCLGLSYQAIADKQPRDNRSKRTAEGVRKAAMRAAELLIGPSWVCWFRYGE